MRIFRKRWIRLSLEELTNILCKKLNIPISSSDIIYYGVAINDYLSGVSFDRVNAESIFNSLHIFLKNHSQEEYAESWRKKYDNEFKSSLSKTLHLYLQYNLIFISRLFYNHTVDKDKSVEEWNYINEIKKIYTQIRKKITGKEGIGDESLENKLAINTPREHLSFLIHLIRQGVEIKKHAELANHFVKKINEQDATVVLKNMDCEDSIRFLWIQR